MSTNHHSTTLQSRLRAVLASSTYAISRSAAKLLQAQVRQRRQHGKYSKDARAGQLQRIWRGRFARQVRS